MKIFMLQKSLYKTKYLLCFKLIWCKNICKWDQFISVNVEELFRYIKVAIISHHRITN